MLSPDEQEQRRLEHREARHQLLGMMLSRGEPESRKEPADIPLILICATVAIFAFASMILWGHHVAS